MAETIVPRGLGLTDDTMIAFADAIDGPCHTVYHLLVPLALFLAFAGLLMAAYRVQMGGDLSGLGTQLLLTLIVGVMIRDQFIPRYLLNLTEVMLSVFGNATNFTVGDIFVEYCKWLGILTAEALPVTITILVAIGFMGIGLGFIAVATIAILLIATPWVLLGLAYGAVLVGYFTHIAAIYFGIAVLPIFLGMLLYEQTRSTAIRYIQGLVAVTFWPVGWALGYFVVHGIIKEDGPLWELIFGGSATSIALNVINVALAGVLGSALALLLTGMLLAVLTKAPGFIARAIESGSQVGTGLASAAASGGTSAAGGTLGQAAGIGMSAVSSGMGGGGMGGGGKGGGGGGGGAAMGKGGK
jgi:hypothetical protein